MGYYTLSYDRGSDLGTKDIAVYGITEDSSYWEELNVGNGTYVLGTGLVKKFGLDTEDTVEFYDQLQDTTYEISYDATWGSNSSTALFMSLEGFNELFGNDADYFNSYLSNEELTIDSHYLAGEITPDSVDDAAGQFVDAMGEMANLYIHAITIVVVVSTLVSLPCALHVLSIIFQSMMLSYNGYIAVVADAHALGMIVTLTLMSYAAVAILRLRNIYRIPLSLALKVTE